MSVSSGASGSWSWLLTRKRKRREDTSIRSAPDLPRRFWSVACCSVHSGTSCTSCLRTSLPTLRSSGRWSRYPTCWRGCPNGSSIMPFRPILDDVRAFAVRRSLFTPTTLRRAIRKLGFIQADPIRAPARAQDLTLRHRVKGYRAGDLELNYAKLDVEEDFFINYGFMWRSLQVLLHPRGAHFRWSRPRRRRAQALLEFVRKQGVVHPREVDRHFAHGTVTNYWGGLSSATTHLLDDMHYRGLLRVVRREAGIRVYAARDVGQGPGDLASRRARIDRLVDVVVELYAPLPGVCLSTVVRRLRYAVPQWRAELGRALERARKRLSHAHVDGTDWYWPAGEPGGVEAAPPVVRLLAPFDPVVWDRRRFEVF